MNLISSSNDTRRTTIVDTTRTESGSQGLVDRIHALLPHTQCTKCGYSGCRPYAEAIANDSAEINRCPPGGQAGIDALATLLHRPRLALDANCGVEGPRRVAFIVESLCIGCTKCIQACPIDAIVGASKRMHTVLNELCSGCDLCVAPCPVDCIEMRDELPDGSSVPQWSRADADKASQRYEQRSRRLHDEGLANERRLKAKTSNAAPAQAEGSNLDRIANTSAPDKQATVAAALARARAKRLSDASDA